MELGFYKSVGGGGTPLHRLDGRLKTIIFLFCVVVSAIVNWWFLAAVLLAASITAFCMLHIPWRLLSKRLWMPFGIAWLVFLNLMFTNGSHPLYMVMAHPFTLIIYSDGMGLGMLMMLRIMAAVTTATVLSLCTPMAEILETLRICKLPRVMVDIADMMFRYIFIIDETAHNMFRAQASRTTVKLSWAAQVRNTGKIAANTLVHSLDRSIRIYNAMLSRGYSEDNPPPPYFTNRVPVSDWRRGAVMMALPAGILLINYLI